MFVIVSKIKEFISGKGMQSSGDFAQALSDKIGEIVEAAMKRAESNGRKTVRPEDL